MQYCVETGSSFPNQALVFTCLQYKSFFENAVGKGEIAPYTNFSLFCSVLYPFGELSTICMKIKIIITKLFQFGRV